MRLISRYHIIREGKGFGSEVQEYKFEWDTEKSTLASRRLYVAPVPEQDLADCIDAFRVPGDMADEWYWREQMELLTQGDVDQLINTLEKQDGRVSFIDQQTNRVA